MNPVYGVTEYRNAMARRLRLSVLIRGFANSLAVALCFTAMLAWFLPRLQPSPAYLTYACVSLLVCFGMSAIAVAIPVMRLRSMVVARAIERRFPPAYESAVAPYYKRLSEAQGGARQ